VIGEVQWPTPQEIRTLCTKDPASGCWVWNRKLNRKHYDNGYGVYTLKRVIDGETWTRMIGAHRMTYTVLRGPIPPGLTIDHLCRNSRCVNPDHLEPVTQEENVRRAKSLARKRTCKRGHPMTATNLVTVKQQSFCRECRRSTANKRVHDRVYTPIPRDPKRKNRFAAAVQRQLLRAVDGGEALADIARRYDYDPTLLWHFKKRHRPDMKEVYTPIPKDPRDKRKYDPKIAVALIAAIDRGERPADIARGYNFNPILVGMLKQRHHPEAVRKYRTRKAARLKLEAA